MMDARAERTELRLKLLENGFIPLPNKNKICYMPGWNTVIPVPASITSKTWARSKALDTGIRCDGIIAIDWDINDAALLNKLLAAVVEDGVVVKSDFVRVGKRPREMWIYRIETPHGKRTTGMFRKGEEDRAEQVEILGRGCQFAAYGMRDETTAYDWPAKSLADHRREELPLITAEQIATLKEYAITFFEREGLHRVSSGGGTDKGYSHAYDLNHDMVFEVQDMGPMALREIEDYLSEDPEAVLRCEVSTLRPGTSGSWAGMVSMVGDHICVSDHGSSTTHFLPEADYVGITEQVAAKLAKMFPSGYIQNAPPPPPAPAPDIELDPDKGFTENLATAVARFAFVSSNAKIYDIKTSHEFTRDGFQLHVAQYYQMEIGPKGGEKLTPLSDAWFRHPNRINAHSVIMRPDQPHPFFEENGFQYINTYIPNELPTGGDASIGIKFLKHLIPIDAERHYFSQWWGHKIRHPDDRLPAVVMVAHQTYGTGRTSLAKLMAILHGRRYVRELDFQTLSGQGSQSQYNEWAVDSLIVVINEAKEETLTGNVYRERDNTYEHIKNIIDTTTHEIHVKRKGVANYQGRTSVSTLVMTNHANAFKFPLNDRRIFVCENGVQLSPDDAKELHEWMTVPANVGAFREYLRMYPPDGFDAFAAPALTRSKIDMVESNRSAMDMMVDEVFESFEGPLLVVDQLELRVVEFRKRVDVKDLPDNVNVDTLLRVFYKRMTRNLQIPRINFYGTERTVRAIRGKPLDESILTSVEAIQQEVLKNGPLMKPAEQRGNVTAISNATNIDRS